MKAILFCKKEPKNPCPSRRVHPDKPATAGQKVFASFSKKKCFLLILLTISPTAQAENPDWPCAQRLVATLSPGSYWTGQIPAQTAWREDDKLFALVTDAVNRDTPEPEGTAKLRAYIATLPPDQRAAAMPALFSAIVDQTNDQRSLLIARLEQLGRRQRGMGEAIAALSNRLDSLPAGDPGREALTGERDFDVRAFQETQHTMRYACEAPANMERRLGSYARVLKAAAP